MAFICGVDAVHEAAEDGGPAQMEAWIETLHDAGFDLVPTQELMNAPGRPFAAGGGEAGVFASRMGMAISPLPTPEYPARYDYLRARGTRPDEPAGATSVRRALRCIPEEITVGRALAAASWGLGVGVAVLFYGGFVIHALWAIFG